MIKVLEETKHTKVIIVGLPLRFDKPALNKIMKSINSEIRVLVMKYGQSQFLSLDMFYKRRYYSRLGLYFNVAGKGDLFLF